MYYLTSLLFNLVIMWRVAIKNILITNYKDCPSTKPSRLKKLISYILLLQSQMKRLLDGILRAGPPALLIVDVGRII